MNSAIVVLPEPDESHPAKLIMLSVNRAPITDMPICYGQSVSGLSLGKRMFGRAIISGLILALALATGASAAPWDERNREALLLVVEGCVALKTLLGVSFPCEDVVPPASGNPGYTIIKSPRYSSEYLFTPATPVVGLESPEARSPGIARLFQLAWMNRQRLNDKLGRDLAPTSVGLVVNSAGTRAQDQFHIHLDCVSDKVAQKLAGFASGISTEWVQFPTPLGGTRYWIKAIEGTDLAHANIVANAASLPALSRGALNKVSVAVIGAALPNGPGFYLLVNNSNVAAENLLDHTCGNALRPAKRDGRPPRRSSDQARGPRKAR